MKRPIHGGARSDWAMRRTIQSSTETLTALAEHLGINRKTVRKWRQRASVEDGRSGRRDFGSTILTREEEAMIVGLRLLTHLSLDDCLYALLPTIPRLTRSALHRCLQRHGLSKLPEPLHGKAPSPMDAPLGHFRLRVARVQTSEGDLHLKLAVERATKVIYGHWFEDIDRRCETRFLSALIQAVPYQIRSFLILDGEPQPATSSPEIKRAAWGLEFERRCQVHQIEVVEAKFNECWVDGKFEKIAETLTHPTVERPQFGSKLEARQHTLSFLEAYNFTRKLKGLGGFAPFDFVHAAWLQRPEAFTREPQKVDHSRLETALGARSLGGAQKQ